MKKKFGFILLFLFFTSIYCIAQFNGGQLYKFNTKISVSPLNYELKGEYSFRPKFLATLGLGYGMNYLFLTYRRFDMYQDPSASKDGAYNFGYSYFTFSATADFKYYILKKRLNLAESFLSNQGFYFLMKMRFLGNESDNEDFKDPNHRIKCHYKIGLGYGFNREFGKSKRVGLEFQHGFGTNINAHMNYMEFAMILHLNVYLNLYRF